MNVDRLDHRRLPFISSYWSVLGPAGLKFPLPELGEGQGEGSPWPNAAIIGEATGSRQRAAEDRERAAFGNTATMARIEGNWYKIGSSARFRAARRRRCPFTNTIAGRARTNSSCCAP